MSVFCQSQCQFLFSLSWCSLFNNIPLTASMSVSVSVSAFVFVFLSVLCCVVLCCVVLCCVVMCCVSAVSVGLYVTGVS